MVKNEHFKMSDQLSDSWWSNRMKKSESGLEETEADG